MSYLLAEDEVLEQCGASLARLQALLVLEGTTGVRRQISISIFNLVVGQVGARASFFSSCKTAWVRKWALGICETSQADSDKGRANHGDAESNEGERDQVPSYACFRHCKTLVAESCGKRHGYLYTASSFFRMANIGRRVSFVSQDCES